MLHEVMGWPGPPTHRQWRVWKEWAFPDREERSGRQAGNMLDMEKAKVLGIITGGGSVGVTYKTLRRPMPDMNEKGQPVDEHGNVINESWESIRRRLEVVN